MARRDRKKPAGPVRKGPVHKEPARPAPPRRRAWDRRDTRNAAIVFGVALLLRLVFFVLDRRNNPLFDYPIMDAKYHLEWARKIIAGDFLGDEVFFRAPLYPYLLALLYKIGGAKIGFVILCQHVMGSASAVLVYALSRRYFAAGAALAAGLLTALYWPLVYFEGDLLFETLFVFLMLVLLVVLSEAIARPSKALLLASGAVLGLTAITRPPILILIPVLPLVFYYSWSPRRTEKPERRAWIRATVLVVAGSLLFILPVTVRNYVVGRDFVPIASQGGVNFYIGNNPQSDGRTAIVPGTRWDWWGGYEDSIRLAETAMGRKLKPSEVSDYYFKKGIEFILTEPDKSIPLFAKKLYLFWAAGERSNNKYIYFFWHQSGMGKVPLPGFWFVAPLGLLGGFLLWRRRRELSLLYLFAAAYMVAIVAFFINDRFRTPVAPVLAVFAGYSILHLWTSWRNDRPAVWKALAVLSVCAVFVNADLIRFAENKTEEDALSHYTLGNAYLNRGDTDKAIAEYEDALARYRKYQRPGFLLVARNVEYNLGRLYWSRKNCARAITHLEKVGGSDQYALLTLDMLAECYTSEKRYENAIEAYRVILRAVPQNRKAKLGLARSYRLAGDLDQAEATLNELLAGSPPPGAGQPGRAGESPEALAESDAIRAEVNALRKARGGTE
jgi:4-amino-4-deoxy-L-arabinose transferase-like glycosyltransferase